MGKHDLIKMEMRLNWASNKLGTKFSQGKNLRHILALSARPDLLFLSRLHRFLSDTVSLSLMMLAMSVLELES